MKLAHYKMTGLEATQLCPVISSVHCSRVFLLTLTVDKVFILQIKQLFLQILLFQGTTHVLLSTTIVMITSDNHFSQGVITIMARAITCPRIYAYTYPHCGLQSKAEA